MVLGCARPPEPLLRRGPDLAPASTHCRTSALESLSHPTGASGMALQTDTLQIAHGWPPKLLLDGKAGGVGRDPM